MGDSCGDINRPRSSKPGQMTSCKPLILRLCLLLGLASCCNIPSVEEIPEGQIADPTPMDLLQMIPMSPEPGSVILIDQLHQEGFNFDELRNADGLTVLMLAAEHRLARSVLALLAAGVDTTLRSPHRTKYVGGWYCMDVIPERSAAEYARKNGDRILGAVIDNYQKLLQLYLIRGQLLDNPDGAINFSDIPLELVNGIATNMLNLLK